jgi:acetyltransferase-like isoleucine patch superfamily enzyme
MLSTFIKFCYQKLSKMRLSVTSLIGRTKLRYWGRAQLGRNVRVRGKIQLHVSIGGKFVIEDNVQLNSGFSNPVGHECITSFFVGIGGRLTIAEGAGISGTTIVCREEVTIGKDTYIGGGCRIYDTDFHSLDANERLRGDDQAINRPVRIGAECFLGGHSLILKGVTIGDQSVVGAGSVVTKDIPPRQIWAGNPARFVRELPAEKVTS